MPVCVAIYLALRGPTVYNTLSYQTAGGWEVWVGTRPGQSTTTAESKSDKSNYIPEAVVTMLTCVLTPCVRPEQKISDK